MSDVVLEHLGKAIPGEHGHPPEHVDNIKPWPIVLWQGSTPAAVLYYREHSRAPGLSSEQRIEKLAGGSGWHQGPFPLVFGSPVSPSGQVQDGAGSFDINNLVTADVNGDGVDELLLPRANGAIGVYGVDKLLFEQWAPTAPPGMTYKVDQKYTMKLAGRDVVFFVLVLQKGQDQVRADEAARAKAERHVLYRVDQKGIARVVLAHVQVGEILAIGALDRPGSLELDELLLLFGSGGKVFLSRHRVDGSAIEPPKEFYVRTPASWARFHFLAGTTQAILESGTHLLFIRPEKASNWIADVDLGPLAKSQYDIETLQAVDAGADPKVTVAVKVWGKEGGKERLVGMALHAINGEGKSFRPDPAGPGWQPLSARGPYLQVTNPTPQHELRGLVAQPGTDIVLAVYTREAQLKELSDDEVMKAAERFLRPEVIAGARKNNEVDFGVEALADFPSRVGEERTKREVTEEITSVDQWKRLLPDSYAHVLAFATRGFLISLRGALESGAERPIDPEKYQNIEEYKTWLASLHVGPESVFEIIRRGEVTTRFQIAAFLPTDSNFDSRIGATGASVVLPLDVTPSVGATKQPLGFHLVQLNRKIF